MKVMDYIAAHRDDDDSCECMVLSNGEVEEPLPSHIGKLTELAGIETKVLHARMEKHMEPLFWMVEFTGCMSVWETRVVSPSEPTAEQMETLEVLYDAAFLAPGYLLEKAGKEYVESVLRAREELGLGGA